MTQSALAAFLRRLRLRSEIGREEADVILDLDGRVEKCARHEDVIVPGDHVTHAILIIDGLAARYDQMGSGQRQYTALHISGDMCDRHSAVLPVATWGVEALNPLTILRIPHGALLDAAESHPAIARAFWRDTTADGGIFTKWAANLGRKPALGRMAHLICEMGVRMEQAGLGTRTDYPIEVTQDQLADALGLTPVHVNRTLKTLRAAQLIRTGRKRMEVLDWHGLVARADFDAGYLQFLRHPAKAPAAAAARDYSMA